VRCHNFKIGRQPPKCFQWKFDNPGGLGKKGTVIGNSTGQTQLNRDTRTLVAGNLKALEYSAIHMDGAGRLAISETCPPTGHLADDMRYEQEHGAKSWRRLPWQFRHGARIDCWRNVGRDHVTIGSL
jgi:hypothetical protein